MVSALARHDVPCCPFVPLDQRQMPIVSAIASYRRSGTISFSTPGHKGGAGFDPALRDLLGDDLGEADVWLNPADHAAALTAAERLAAGAWGADRTFFLTNGSSAGNQALMLAMVGPGDTVIVGRDLHQSLLTALILTGARPIYLPPRLHPELGVGIGIDPEDLAAALAANPETRLVSVVSPTYWGVTSELQALAAIAHQWDVPFVVDAAWGPHFGFSTALPASALTSGADAAITSPHKVLSGLSQAALLHVRGERIDAARVASAVAMTRTTSPLLPILASLDACRRQLAIDGERMLGRVVTLAAGARRRLRAIPGIDLLDADRLGLPPRRVDPTRLVLDLAGIGLTGMAAERALRDRFAIAPEMSDLLGVICLITPGDTGHGIDRLVGAMAALAGERRPRFTSTSLLRSATAAVAPGPQALTPREAYFAPARPVPLRETVGAVGAEAVVPYPPGIPVFTPGEIITAVKVDYLRAVLAEGLHIRGPADPTLETLRVVA
ncbi:MAG: DegT/DnrJ/EryC1/StrS family aminotransferase [Thermomicrobiales bacterium]